MVAGTCRFADLHANYSKGNCEKQRKKVYSVWPHCKKEQMKSSSEAASPSPPCGHDLRFRFKQKARVIHS